MTSYVPWRSKKGIFKALLYIIFPARTSSDARQRMKKRCKVSRNRKSEASKKITKKFIFCIYIYIYTRNALFGDFFACHKSFRQVLLTKKSFRVHVICHVGYAFDRSIECKKKIVDRLIRFFQNDKKMIKK